MRNLIVAVAAVLWGGAIVISGLTGGIATGSGSYAAGSVAAFVVGIVLLLAGSRVLIKRARS
jgi:hypothetical protein